MTRNIYMKSVRNRDLLAEIDRSFPGAWVFGSKISLKNLLRKIRDLSVLVVF